MTTPTTDATEMATAEPVSGSAAHEVHGDDDCRRRAAVLVERLAGEPRPITWDVVHPLQGHVVIADVRYVVIAPRDDAHAPIVIAEDDWCRFRRGGRDGRAAMLQLAVDA